MSIQLNASGDSVYRTATLPSPGGFTACGWFRVTAHRGDYATLFSLENATSSSTLGVALNLFPADDLHLVWAESSGVWRDLAFSRAIPEGEWFFAAIACWGVTTGDLVGYLWRWGDTTVEVVSNNAGFTTFTPAHAIFGNNSYSEWFNGDIAFAKAWDERISQANVEGQVMLIEPYYATNLHGDWRLPNASDVGDSGPNNFDLTAGGTLGSSDDPPLGGGIARLGSPLRPAFFKGGAITR